MLAKISTFAMNLAAEAWRLGKAKTPPRPQTLAEQMRARERAIDKQEIDDLLMLK